MIGLMESFEAFIYIGAITMACVSVMVASMCKLKGAVNVGIMLMIVAYIAALFTVLINGLTKGF